MGALFSLLLGGFRLYASLLGGLVTNLLQLASFVGVRPFSRNLDRRLNWHLARAAWAPLVAVLQPSIEIVTYGSADAWKGFCHKNAVAVANHVGELDWLVCWSVAERENNISACKALMKKANMYIPFLGWSWRCLDFPFLSRNWPEDQKTLEEAFRNLRAYPPDLSYFLTVYAEGSRATPQKIVESQQFARERGLPILGETLYPRSRGLFSALQALKGSCSYLIDATLAEDPHLRPTLVKMLLGIKFRFHILLERFSVEDLPQDFEGFTDWLYKRWEVKDVRIKTLKATGSFPVPTYPDSRPSVVAERYLRFWMVVLGSLIGWWVLKLSRNLSEAKACGELEEASCLEVVEGGRRNLLLTVIVAVLLALLLPLFARFATPKESKKGQ